jgi:NADPH-dependent glutamate synthase beta subunit-like oxidoreductase
VRGLRTVRGKLPDERAEAGQASSAPPWTRPLPRAIPCPANSSGARKQYNVDYRTDRTDVTDDGTAPCKAKCPAHIPVQGYIKLASQGKYKEALELIKKENPFPAVCGRICNKVCEDACTRGSVDDPIAIDDIKKFIADQELKDGNRFVPAMLNQTGKPFANKIAVIGAGPAGLSCAYYLKIKGYPVTVFEKEKHLGGMLTMGIPEFRLEKKVVNAEIDILKEMGVEFKTGVEIGKDVTIPELRKQGYEAFYLGIGASKGTSVGCKGDDLEGVYTGIDFLREVNTGAKPAVGKKVAVIGGGNVAIDVARTAVRLGAEKVYVIYRRSEEEMPAAADEVEEARAEGVEFKFLLSPAEIVAGTSGKAAKVVLDVNELGEPDAKGRRKPVPTGKTETIAVTAVISAIGQKVDTCGIENGTRLAFNKNGTVLADPVTCQTGEPDIFRRRRRGHRTQVRHRRHRGRQGSRRIHPPLCAPRPDHEHRPRPQGLQASGRKERRHSHRLLRRPRPSAGGLRLPRQGQAQLQGSARQLHRGAAEEGDRALPGLRRRGGQREHVRGLRRLHHQVQIRRNPSGKGPRPQGHPVFPDSGPRRRLRRKALRQAPCQDHCQALFQERRLSGDTHCMRSAL